MENAVQVYEAMPLSAEQIRGQVNLIQEVMKSVMRENEHYGKTYTVYTILDENGEKYGTFDTNDTGAIVAIRYVTEVQ
jgi:hypothetical protein